MPAAAGAGLALQPLLPGEHATSVAPAPARCPQRHCRCLESAAHDGASNCSGAAEAKVQNSKWRPAIRRGVSLYPASWPCTASLFDRHPPGVRDVETNDLDHLAVIRLDALAPYYCEPGADESNERFKREPASVHKGFGGPLRIAGEHF